MMKIEAALIQADIGGEIKELEPWRKDRSGKVEVFSQLALRKARISRLKTSACSMFERWAADGITILAIPFALIRIFFLPQYGCQATWFVSLNDPCSSPCPSTRLRSLH
jgi:hypothetical protein